MNRFHARPAAMVALAAALVALTACGGDDDESSSAAIAPSETMVQAPESGEQVVSDDAPAATTAPVDDGSTSAPDRLLIVDVTVGVEVADVGDAVSELVALGRRHDAQVYGSDVQLRDEASSRGTVVFKVPPANIEAMIAEVSALGRQVSRTQRTDDVTDRVTDLETRIATARESVDRVQRLLVEATDLGQVVLLESELTTRQTTLEQLLAEQRNLGNRTALATLTVELSTAPAASETPAADGEVDDDGVGDAFREGGRAFLTAIVGILIFVGYTAPFLAVGLVALGVVVLISRRRQRRNRSAAPPPPPAPVGGQRTTEPDSAGAARS